MGDERPFRVHVSDESIELLKRKLELHRFPDELQGATWDYGVPLDDIKRLVARWKDGYDWKKFEDKLNDLPMFARDIEVEGHGTLNIHYIHQTSSVKGAIPLLFVHGCTWIPNTLIYIPYLMQIALHRARQLHRGSEVDATPDGISSQPSKLSLGRTESSRLRLLGGPA